MIRSASPAGCVGYSIPLTAHAVSPVAVELPEAVRSMAAGMHFSIALGASGCVYAWGWNALGQLGLNDSADRCAPTGVSGLEHVEAIAAGEAHACALTSAALYGWGSNASGQIGAAARQQPRPAEFLRMR